MWNKVCEEIFVQTIEEYKKNNIRYFILRNYEGLPGKNIAKDVDIIIEPGKYREARKILLSSYKKNGCSNYYEAEFYKLHCLHGISVDKEIVIHIDLIEGYTAKGYEIFTFDEMYTNTEIYNGLYVLNECFDGMMLLIYKLFGYKKPEIKETYREKIYTTYKKYPKAFTEKLELLTGKTFAKRISQYILNYDFDSILLHADKFTSYLKRYALKKDFIKTIVGTNAFFWGKVSRIVLCYKKYARVIAVIAPDGTGKTTFIDNIVKQINKFYVNDEEDMRCDIHHFRPTLLPNLGELGEKAGIMEQDKDWTNPHRGEPANPVSSLLRMMYYTMDYIIGWQKIVRKNVHYDKFTIFDRYSYDFIVDPYRSKIKLPMFIRKFFVALTPKPKIVFVLHTDSEIIFKRKQELDLEEINRQLKIYESLLNSNKRFYEIDASKAEDEMSLDGVNKIIKTFTKKF